MNELTHWDTVSEVKLDNISYNHHLNKHTAPEMFSYHTHDRYELIFLIKGDMQYISEGRCYNLEVGDLVLTRPSVFHAMMPKSVTHYDRYDAIINEKLISKSIRDKIPKMREVFKCAGNDRIFELFSKLDQYYGKFSEEDYGRLAFNIIEEVIYNLALIDEEGERGSVNPLIDKATSYIREHLTEIRNIDEISSALYITKSHLHHLFIKDLHMTPGKYILSKRLLLAEKRILRGEKPTDIFTECGFDDYATFFRNYKKHFGISPSATAKTEITRVII